MDNKEDTIYFGDENPNEYENNQRVYSEEDMYEEEKPLVTINSVEYDEGDYACDYNDVEEVDEEANKKRHNNIILAYIGVLIAIVVIVILALIKSLK